MTVNSKLKDWLLQGFQRWKPKALIPGIVSQPLSKFELFFSFEEIYVFFCVLSHNSHFWHSFDEIHFFVRHLTKFTFSDRLIKFTLFRDPLSKLTLFPLLSLNSRFSAVPSRNLRFVRSHQTKFAFPQRSFHEICFFLWSCDVIWFFSLTFHEICEFFCYPLKKFAVFGNTFSKFAFMTRFFVHAFGDLSSKFAFFPLPFDIIRVFFCGLLKKSAFFFRGSLAKISRFLRDQ